MLNLRGSLDEQDLHDAKWKCMYWLFIPRGKIAGEIIWHFDQVTKFTIICEGQMEVSSDPRGGDSLKRARHLGGVLAKNSYTDSNYEKIGQIFKMRHFLLKNGVGKLYSPKITEDIKDKVGSGKLLAMSDPRLQALPEGEVPWRTLSGRCLGKAAHQH